MTRPIARRLNGVDLDSLQLMVLPATAAVTDRRDKITRDPQPAAIRLAGPIGGHRDITDTDRLRLEAARLIDAADLLDEIHATDTEAP